jgi:nitrite reductase/ring-hydroxylating ferredoxin subunit
MDNNSESNTRWWCVSSTNQPRNGDRIHVCIEDRYITIFRYNRKLSAIDSVCHHAGMYALCCVVCSN